jgi:hypothetical protein
MQLRLLASLTEHSAAADNATAELALMEAIDRLDAAKAGQ